MTNELEDMDYHQENKGSGTFGDKAAALGEVIETARRTALREAYGAVMGKWIDLQPEQADEGVERFTDLGLLFFCALGEFELWLTKKINEVQE